MMQTHISIDRNTSLSFSTASSAPGLASWVPFPAAE